MSKTPNKNIIAKVKERVEECYKKAESFYGVQFPKYSIDYSLVGSTAGQADFRKKSLRFNRKLLMGNESTFFEVVIPHECCHAFDFHMNYGKDWKPHGKSWKHCMISVFGLSPKVTHRMDTSKTAIKSKQYKYTCGCDGKFHMVGLIRHKRALRGNDYVCTKCSETLLFEKKESGVVTENKRRRFATEIELD